MRVIECELVRECMCWHGQVKSSRHFVASRLPILNHLLDGFVGHNNLCRPFTAVWARVAPLGNAVEPARKGWRERLAMCEKGVCVWVEVVVRLRMGRGGGDACRGPRGRG
jgi:hypothetical protein